MPISEETAKPPARSPARKPTVTQARQAATAAANAVAEARMETATGILQVATLALIARNQYADAGAISVHGPKLAKETVRLAETDEKVAAAFNYLTAATPYTGIILAGLPLLLQFAANHGRIKPGAMPGIVDPAKLEETTRAQIQKQHDEACKALKEAMEGDD